MSDTGWGSVFVLGLAALVAIILVAIIWQVFKTAQTKTAADATFAQEAAYRTLAEGAVRAQQSTAEWQRKMATDLADLRDRVAAMEKLLREVG